MIDNARQWLIALRGERSQAEIAEAAGISQQMYSAIECGRCSPSVKLAKRLAPIVGCSWQAFFDGQQAQCVNE